MNLKIELTRRRLYSVAEDPNMWHVLVPDLEYPGNFIEFTAPSQAEGIRRSLIMAGIDGIEIEVK